MAIPMHPLKLQLFLASSCKGVRAHEYRPGSCLMLPYKLYVREY